MTTQIFTPNSLFGQIKSALCLAALVGNTKPIQALRLANEVYEQFPAFFPDFALCLADEPLDPRSACWSLAEDLKNTPGAYDIWKQAKEIAQA